MKTARLIDIALPLPNPTVSVRFSWKSKHTKRKSKDELPNVVGWNEVLRFKIESIVRKSSLFVRLMKAVSKG